MLYIYSLICLNSLRDIEANFIKNFIANISSIFNDVQNEYVVYMGLLRVQGGCAWADLVLFMFATCYSLFLVDKIGLSCLVSVSGGSASYFSV